MIRTPMSALIGKDLMKTTTSESFPQQHRPVTMAPHGLVASPHYLASQAGVDILKKGGTAVDAAIATNAVLNVVYPHMCGIGGDAFWLIYSAAQKDLAFLNASGRSPYLATLEYFQKAGMDADSPAGTSPGHYPRGCRRMV